MGIGGSVTITASGGFLPDIPLQASGITLPPGIPVRVEVTGQVTRTQTPGLQEFCAFFVQLCEDFAFFLGEDPVPPSGVPQIEAAVAFAAWDGAEGIPAPTSGPILTGPSGSELWVGRSQFLCEFSWIFGSGPCFTFGGSYTYTVHADSGDATAHLLLTVTAQDLGPSGGTVDLEVETSDGSDAVDLRWYFVPDGGGTIDGGEPPVTAAADIGSSASGEAGIRLGGRERVERAPQASAASQPVAAAAFTSLAHCDASTTCEATIDVSAGTFVATGLVHGTPRAAERRVSEGTGGGGAPELKLECVPATVQRGQSVTCTASSVDPAKALAVTGWQFQPDASHLTTIVRSSGVDEVTWAGTMATSGVVEVAATVAGAPAEATARIDVTDRSPLTANFPAPEVTDDGDMSERPYQIPGEPGLFHIGHIHAGDHAIRIPGNVDVIGQGPNGGLAYFTANPYETRWVIHINLSQLQANSELGQRHRLVAPAFEASPTCLRSQLAGLVGPIAEHEGRTMHPRSHAGRYAAKFNDLGGPAIERLVEQVDLVRAVDDALRPAIAAADAESAKADSDFRPVLCRLNLFPAPR